MVLIRITLVLNMKMKITGIKDVIWGRKWLIRISFERGRLCGRRRRRSRWEWRLIRKDEDENYEDREVEDYEDKKVEDYEDKEDEDYKDKEDEDYKDKEYEDHKDKEDENYKDKEDKDYEEKEVEDYEDKEDEDYEDKEEPDKEGGRPLCVSLLPVNCTASDSRLHCAVCLFILIYLYFNICLYFPFFRSWTYRHKAILL